MASNHEDYFCTAPPGWSLAPRYAGREECSPGHGWMGIRDHFLLHYVVSGAGIVGAGIPGAREALLGPGDVFLYSPESRISYRADSSNPWHYRWVGFSGPLSRKLVEETGVSHSDPVLAACGAHSVGIHLASLMARIRDRKSGYITTATGLLYLILGELATAFRPPLRSRSAVLRTATDELIALAKEFIEQNYQKSISISDVVRYVGLERSYLARQFHTCFGTSMHSYLIALRMRRARELVLTTKLPVAAVASSVGYRGYEAFERKYRATFAESPRTSRAREKMLDPR